MTQQEINQACNRAIGSLDSKELKNALDTLQGLISGNRLFSFQDRLNDIHDTYRNMLRYRTEGAKDPMQEHIYRSLQTQSYELADAIKRDLLGKESTLSYYMYLRNTGTTLFPSFDQAHKQLKTEVEVDNQLGYENSLTDLFNRIWLSDTLSLQDTEEIKAILADNALPHHIGCQIVSALTLGLQTMFDNNKIMLLFDAASHIHNEIRVRAYIGILLTLYFYRNRIKLYPAIYDRLGFLSENGQFIKTVRTITLRFILARETEKITRKLQDEIIPEMLKLNARINKKTDFTNINPEQLTEGMNPEWMEMLEGSEISKKIEEFSELQQEGADVMHSTFTHLKSFSFFSKIANWFLPFNPNLSIFHSPGSTDKETSQILNLLESAPFMCNSDKYSLYLSVMQLPESHRSLMIGQFSSQAEEMLKQNKEELLSNIDNTATLASQYIQDLYRFHKLHPAHLDFDDIFSFPLDFHNLDILKPYLSDEESLTIIAEYYLHKNYFADALAIYDRLANEQMDNAMLFQKTGYCRQMNGDFEGALDDYLHADIIAPDKWLTRRIAFCYKALKLPQDALKYYLRYDKLQPDNLSVLSSIGHCYLELKDYNEALKYYYKVDYLDNKSHKTWRPIAWCSFLIGKYDQARNYYKKIMEESASSQDYLNAGHTEWALQNLKGALAFYKEAIRLESGDINRFKELFYEDKEDLLVAGIEEEEFPLMLDQLMYSL
ncbi:tetratricopeptide repeat protein [Massilibacteroides vaginae]|uniref:tetratricopeptide repeat protein n=1 Tax=Massilibacteroides vaginae TaxID=1673718 RepID=UPI000A1CD09F|nr:hypothetical protein [Massilibacteroides vaginae]